MSMFILWMTDHKGDVYYWLGEHRYTRLIADAKHFDTKAQAEIERWNVAGTDTRIAEVLV